MMDTCASWLAGDELFAALEGEAWPATAPRRSGCLPVLLAGALALLCVLGTLGAALRR